MRKAHILVALAATVGFAVLAAGTVQAQSCAVGGFVTGKSKGAIQQILAFTTNSTFFITYAGAITTGTSGCSSSGIVKEEYEQEVFVAASYDGLLQDMAQGGGAYLRSFAELMGCEPALYGDLAQWSQANLERLSADPGTPQAWVAGVRQNLALHPSLSGCTRVG